MLRNIKLLCLSKFANLALIAEFSHWSLVISCRQITVHYLLFIDLIFVLVVTLFQNFLPIGDSPEHCINL